MPVAIRMANGAAYYPQGFEHAAYDADMSRGTRSYQSNRQTRGSNEDQYRRYMLSIGYVENPYQDFVFKNQKFIKAERLPEVEAAYQAAYKQAQNTFKKGQRDKFVNDAVDAVKGAGKAVASVPGKVGDAAKLEGARIKAGYGRGTYRYDQAHKNEDGTQGGNKFGRTMAGVAGAVGNTTAYKLGKAAVSKAGEMLSIAGKGAKWAGGKALEGAKWAGGKVAGGAGKAFSAIKEAAVGAGGKIANSAVGQAVGGAAGRVASDFKGIAQALGNTAAGQAAKKAGEAALKAGGSVVGAVGGALQGILKFFGNVGSKAWGGIKTGAGWVGDRASDVGDWVGNKFKKKDNEDK